MKSIVPEFGNLYWMAENESERILLSTSLVAYADAIYTQFLSISVSLVTSVERFIAVRFPFHRQRYVEILPYREYKMLVRTEESRELKDRKFSYRYRPKKEYMFVITLGLEDSRTEILGAFYRLY